MNVQIDPQVFNDVYLPYLNVYARTQIFFGGSGSGKSVFLAQRVIYDLLKGGRNYLVCRQVARTVLGSVAQEIGKVIAAWGLGGLFTTNKVDGVITCQNGYQVIFAGLDGVEKLKSLVPAKGVITDIWVEEATEVEQGTVKQLVKRQRGGDAKTPKRITLSFNPILQTHWIYKTYFSKIGWAEGQKEYKNDSLVILKTTHEDNRFLTQDDRNDLTRETDPYFYAVYTLGNWGILGNVIFTNWKVEDLSGMADQFTNRRCGLDFGYSADPAAVLASHYDRSKKTIYVFAELYQTGMTNDKLAEEAKTIIDKDAVTCDSAEPKSIVELRQYGVDARPARKGKDSVTHGIQWLQQNTIIVDKSCINMQNELAQYKWKEDAGGNPLPIPVDKNDHLISALRYGYEMDMIETGIEVVENPFDF